MNVLIHLESPGELEFLRHSNRIVADILAELKAQTSPGVSTLELSELGESLAAERNARPAFKGYN